MAFILIAKQNGDGNRLACRGVITVKIKDKKTKTAGIRKIYLIYLTKSILNKLNIKYHTKFLISIDDDNHNLWRMQKTSIDDKNGYTLTVKAKGSNLTSGVLTIASTKLPLFLTANNFSVKSIDDIKFIDEDTIEFELVAAD